jgi:hypothetical protein
MSPADIVTNKVFPRARIDGAMMISRAFGAPPWGARLFVAVSSTPLLALVTGRLHVSDLLHDLV